MVEMLQRERLKELAAFELQMLGMAMFMGSEPEAAIKAAGLLKEELRGSVFHTAFNAEHVLSKLRRQRSALKLDEDMFKILDTF
jgi:hypothetical protein